MTKTTEEKVALVTGSAMGIGLACAEAFAKAGYITVLADIREPGEQVEKLVAEGHKAVAYRCDVSNTQAVKEMIDWTVATYGRLDAALNNAGIQTPQRPMAEITDDEFDRTVAVDLKGVWNCMRYEILQMLKQGGGAIVNNHVRAFTFRETKRHVRTPPIFFQRLAFPSEYRYAISCDSRRRMVLCGEDVTASPANVRSQRN